MFQSSTLNVILTETGQPLLISLKFEKVKTFYNKVINFVLIGRCSISQRYIHSVGIVDVKLNFKQDS